MLQNTPKDSIPLDRAGAEALVDRLSQGTRTPTTAEIESLVRYSYGERPEGIKDYTRATIFGYLEAVLPKIEPQLRRMMMDLIVTSLSSDLRRAESVADLHPPQTIGEVTQLVFYGGDSDALKLWHMQLLEPDAFPRAFYNAFSYDLNIVAKNSGKIPRDLQFLSTLKEIGEESFYVSRTELGHVTQDLSDDRQSIRGKVRNFSATFLQYGFSPNYNDHEKWQLECSLSAFARKNANEKVVEVCAACGIELDSQRKGTSEQKSDEWKLEIKFPLWPRSPDSSGPKSPPDKEKK